MRKGTSIVCLALALVCSTPGYAAGVTANLRGRMLDITGTAGSDLILIYSTGQQVVLEAVDVTNLVVTLQAWPQAQIFMVTVSAGAGDAIFNLRS